ncbi:MAG: hypothetical protein ACRD8W_25950 [Nitrososphaeraceae archaeon]
MIDFDPKVISKAETEYRLENPNTEEIFVPECLKYRYGNSGFICNNRACAGLYCVNGRDELPDNCIYCGIKKKSLTLQVI